MTVNLFLIPFKIVRWMENSMRYVPWQILFKKDLMKYKWWQTNFAKIKHLTVMDEMIGKFCLWFIFPEHYIRWFSKLSNFCCVLITNSLCLFPTSLRNDSITLFFSIFSSRNLNFSFCYWVSFIVHIQCLHFFFGILFMNFKG